MSNNIIPTVITTTNNIISDVQQINNITGNDKTINKDIQIAENIVNTVQQIDNIIDLNE